jgi:hypothetical protein
LAFILFPIFIGCEALFGVAGETWQVCPNGYSGESLLASAKANIRNPVPVADRLADAGLLP